MSEREVYLGDGLFASWDSVGEPRSHYHLYCSEKGNHAGYGREDAVKRYYQDLPPTLRKVVTRFDP
jgi:hypothetical protein